MSTNGSIGPGRSKLQAPTSRLTAPSSRLAATSRLPSTSQTAKPTTTTATTRPVIKPITKTTSRTSSTLTKNSSATSSNSSLVSNGNVNDSTVTSIAESEISSIRSVDETPRVSSSVSLGSLSMSRTSSIGSRAVSSLNKKPVGSSTFRNDTYSIHDNSSTTNKPNSTDILKNIEDVIARNKILEEENLVLKNLIHEENDSRFDERRTLMLKCQIYQLEKQINILSKSLAFRKNAHTEALNGMCFYSDAFRSIIQNAEGRSMTPVKTFSIDRSEFVKWTEMAESTRLKLIRSEDSTMNEENIKEMSEESLLTTKFAKSNANSVDILDVCSGNLNHVNLKHVAVLETSLSKLFRKLTRLQESLRTNLNETPVDKEKKSNNKTRSHLAPMHQENLRTQIDECHKSAQEACTDLFDLSLIIPSAPWAPLKKSTIEQITQETLIAKLKSIGLPKSKYLPVEILLKSFYVANNYHHHMKSNQLAAANEELEFYRSCFSVQKDYIESVMKLFMAKYEGFIGELKENLNGPLLALISKFWSLKEEVNEVNLKEFLAFFTQYAKKFEEVIGHVESMPANDLIGNTFNSLIGQLDTEVTALNNHCKHSLEQLDLNKLDLAALSRESDDVFREIVSLTPKESPVDSPVSSMKDLNDF